jgi:hypothetical protein
VAVDEARQQRAAGRVDLQLRGCVRLEAGDPVALEQHVAGLEAHLRRAVVAQVRQPVGRRAQHLRRAAQADAAHARIGIRTPRRSAASIASS